MNTESPRLRALLAAGAALVVFGITIPATASPDGPGQPGVGTVGKAGEHADPPGQRVNLDENADSNRGFRCDGNNGAGSGNPAHGICEGGTGGGEYGGGDDTGTGTGTGAGGEWSENPS
jgi:hypothetical protein